MNTMKKIDRKFKHVALEYILRRVNHKTLLIPELPSVTEQQSILNLLLLDLTLPQIVVTEDANGVHDIKVNGQVVSTLVAFLNNEIKHEESGLSLDNLPNYNYNHVMDHTLHFVILDPSNTKDECDSVVRNYQNIN